MRIVIENVKDIPDKFQHALGRDLLLVLFYAGFMNDGVNVEFTVDTPKQVRKNRFEDAQTVGAVIRQAVGAASMCWEGSLGDAVFDSDLAIQVSEDAIERIDQLGREKLIGPLLEGRFDR